MDINSILKENNFRFSKKFGQNFLTDTNLLNAIAADAGVSDIDTVLEIGAGAGTLTAAIAAKAKKVVAYEIDLSLQPVLEKTLAGLDNVCLKFGDILKTDAALIGKELGDYKIVANLPYYITTPIIFNFLYEPQVKQITIMVQKEVADRICARAGTAAYGALSAGVQAFGEPKITRTVSRQLFNPQPDVDSAVVNIVIGAKCRPELIPILRRAIACAFAMRRKTLANNLMAGYSMSRQTAESVILKAGIETGVRGETLTVEQFIRLAEIIFSDINKG